MMKCKKCESTHLKQNFHNKYHEVFECLTCGYWEFEQLEDCCRNPCTVIAQDHKFSPQTRLYRQCLSCGGCVNRTKPLSFKAHGDDCEAEFSNDSFGNWRNERGDEAKRLSHEKSLFNYYNSTYYKYQLYLCSYKWKEKRKLALQRDENTCQACKVKPAAEVHHLTYASLFHEPLEDLQSLCRDCHASAHDRTLPKFINHEHQKK